MDQNAGTDDSAREPFEIPSRSVVQARAEEAVQIGATRVRIVKDVISELPSLLALGDYVSDPPSGYAGPSCLSSKT